MIDMYVNGMDWNGTIWVSERQGGSLVLLVIYQLFSHE